MKKLFLFSISLVLTLTVFSQNLKTIETYYDVYSQTKIKERYTVETSRMQKHGLYQSWDQFGTIYEEINYKNGKMDGTAKTYFTQSYIKNLLWESSSFIGKVMEEASFKDDRLNGIRKKYDIQDKQYYLQLEQKYDNGNMTNETEYYAPNKLKHKLNNNGLCEEWYDNGQKEAEYTLLNGVEEGAATVWYNNGNVAAKSVYKNGKLISENRFYPNANRLSEIVYDPATSVLVSMKEYATNQNIKTEIVSTGKSTIKGITYDTIRKEIQSIENFLYMDFGQGRKINFGDGEQRYEGVQAVNHGHAEYFFKGKPVTSGEYKEGYRIGKWKIYYDKDFNETKNLDSVIYYRDITFGDKGIPQGIVTDHYADGTKQWEGQLIEVNPDVFEGECKYYYETGQLLSHQYYYKGLKTGTWNSYYPNGKLTEKVTFANDKPNGEYIQLWENGNKKQEGIYKNGLSQGEWKFYNEDGSLQEITTYDKNGIEVNNISAEQLNTQKEDEKRSIISEQQTKIRQSFILNSPTPQQKTIGDSYEIVFNAELERIGQINNHSAKMKILSQLEKLGSIILSLDEKTIKSFSKSLKGQNSVDSIYKIFGII